MGTFYDFKFELEFAEGQVEAWLGARVAACPGWTDAPSPVRELLAALATGSAANGEEIGPLAFEVGPMRVRAHWRWVASEVAPEVIGAAKQVWASVQTHASGGVFGYRDALGPEALWDWAEVLEGGKCVRVDRWLSELFGSPAPPVEPAPDDSDIPF